LRAPSCRQQRRMRSRQLPLHTQPGPGLPYGPQVLDLDQESEKQAIHVPILPGLVWSSRHAGCHNSDLSESYRGNSCLAAFAGLFERHAFNLKSKSIVSKIWASITRQGGFNTLLVSFSNRIGCQPSFRSDRSRQSECSSDPPVFGNRTTCKADFFGTI